MTGSGKAQILSHMNNDHSTALFDYLNYYGGVKIDPFKPGNTVELVDVNTMEMTLNYKHDGVLNTKVIPFLPQLKSMSELRSRLISMAYESAEAFGYSASPIKSIRLPNFWGWLSAILLGITAALSISPTLSYRLISPRSPTLARIIKNQIRRVLVVTLFAHIVEYFAIMRPTLNRYRVHGTLRLKYKLSAILEGAPSWHRLKEDANKLEEIRQAKLK